MVTLEEALKTRTLHGVATPPAGTKREFDRIQAYYLRLESANVSTPEDKSQIIQAAYNDKVLSKVRLRAKYFDRPDTCDAQYTMNQRCINPQHTTPPQPIADDEPLPLKTKLPSEILDLINEKLFASWRYHTFRPRTAGTDPEPWLVRLNGPNKDIDVSAIRYPTMFLEPSHEMSELRGTMYSLDHSNIFGKSQNSRIADRFFAEALAFRNWLHFNEFIFNDASGLSTRAHRMKNFHIGFRNGGERTTTETRNLPRPGQLEALSHLSQGLHCSTLVMQLVLTGPAQTHLAVFRREAVNDDKKDDGMQWLYVDLVPYGTEGRQPTARTFESATFHFDKKWCQEGHEYQASAKRILHRHDHDHDATVLLIAHNAPVCT